MSYHYFPTPCPHCGGTGSAESCPDRPAAAHAGEPQAGELDIHDCKGSSEIPERFRAGAPIPSGPEPVAAGGSVETEALNQQIEELKTTLSCIVGAYSSLEYVQAEREATAEDVEDSELALEEAIDFGRADLGYGPKLASGGTSPEKGKAPEQPLCAHYPPCQTPALPGSHYCAKHLGRPQSNRQHAGEGKALQLIIAERERQNAKWGVQRHDPITWLAILTEEVGEAAEAALHDRFGGKEAGHFEKEIVQVAAVAVQILEHIAAERAPLVGRERA